MRTLVQRLVVCVAIWLASALPLATALGQDAGAQPTLDDAAIVAAIERAVAGASIDDARSVQVRARAGIVTLTGTVTNLLAYDDIADVAQTVRGVRAVVNRIEVEPPWTRTDEELREDVREALHFDPATDPYELLTTVEKGVVTLRGRAQSFAERNIAGRVVRGVRGVRGVRNEITISYTQRRSDADIKADVDAQLRRDAYFVDHRIDNEVNAGRVKLLGVVGSESERAQAYFDAWVAGVQEVDTTQLRVEPWRRDPAVRTTEPMNDTAIEQALTAAFINDPRVSSFHVEAKAQKGIVTLRGTVNNLNALRAAVEDARSIPSVVRVVDRMQIESPAERDEDVAESIRKALARDPYLERFMVLVNVIHGTAYLRGTVDTARHKTRADQIASSARGVTSVQNRLTVADE